MRVAFVDERGDEIAVGRITKINNRTFHVAVGVNEEIPTGATGYLTENVPTGSLEGAAAGDLSARVCLGIQAVARPQHAGVRRAHRRLGPPTFGETKPS